MHVTLRARVILSSIISVIELIIIIDSTSLIP